MTRHLKSPEDVPGCTCWPQKWEPTPIPFMQSSPELQDNAKWGERKRGSQQLWWWIQMLEWRMAFPFSTWMQKCVTMEYLTPMANWINITRITVFVCGKLQKRRLSDIGNGMIYSKPIAGMSKSPCPLSKDIMRSTMPVAEHSTCWYYGLLEMQASKDVGRLYPVSLSLRNHGASPPYARSPLASFRNSRMVFRARFKQDCWSWLV